MGSKRRSLILSVVRLMSAVGNRFDNETGETRSKAGGQARIFTAFWICKKRVSASYSRQLYMLTEDDSSENTR